MNKNQIVYKVVYANNGNFYSANTGPRVIDRKSKDHELSCLQYKLNEITTPKVGKIFVFKNLKDAISFGNTIISDTDYEFTYLILKCNVIGKLSKIKFKSIYVTDDYITKYWNSKKQKKIPIDKNDAPTGTYLADAIMPIENFYVFK